MSARRNAIVAHAVERITRVFDPPKAITAEQRSARLAAIADAIQFAIPANAPAEHVEAACDGAIRDLTFAAKGTLWPIPRDVIEAVQKHTKPLPAASRPKVEIKGGAASRSERTDDEAVQMARRIAEAVQVRAPVARRDDYEFAWIEAARCGWIGHADTVAWMGAIGVSAHPISAGLRAEIGWPIEVGEGA